jgi:hypothetical protein
MNKVCNHILIIHSTIVKTFLQDDFKELKCNSETYYDMNIKSIVVNYWFKSLDIRYKYYYNSELVSLRSPDIIK